MRIKKVSPPGPPTSRMIVLPVGHHLLDQLDQRTVLEADVVRDVLQGTADVHGQEVEDLADGRGVLADAQVDVEEDSPDVGAVQQVVDVVGQLRELVDLLLILRVDRVELLVDRVELLVGGLQLLVRRDELLVGGLQLLVAGLQLLDGGLEVFLRVDQLQLELADPAGGLAPGVERLGRLGRWARPAGRARCGRSRSSTGIGPAGAGRP